MSLFASALTAAAHAVIGFALFQFCRARHASLLGLLRWVLLAIVALIALIGIADVLASAANARLVAQHLGELAAGGELLAAMMLWPFLRHARSRFVATAGRRIRRRAARADAQVDAAYALLALAERSVPFGHWRLAVDGTLTWSDQMFEIFGWPPDTGPDAAQALALYHPDDREMVEAQLAAAAEGQGEFTLALRIRRPDGGERQVSLRGSGLRNGAVAGIVFDRTGECEAEARLREAQQAALQARSQLRARVADDALTGLPNRQTFEASLIREVKRALRANHPLSLILLDFDWLSHFNRTYTHETGDACLRHIAQALLAVPRRAGDVLARYDGGTFTLLLPLAEARGACRVAETLRAAVLHLAIAHAGTEPPLVTLSAGVAAMHGAQDAHGASELFRRAHLALLAAQRQGGDRVATYDSPPLDSQSPIVLHEVIDAPGP